MSILKTLWDSISRKSAGIMITDHVPESNYRNWGAGDFLRANEISLYVNKAIEKRAEKVGQIRFVLKKGDKEITDDKRLDVLYKPNKYFTGPEFWELYQKYKDLTGEAYILVLRSGELFEGKKVTELHLLRPDLVQHVYDKTTGDITHFIYRPTGGDQRTYEAKEVIYSFRPDPKSPIRGMSLLKAGIRAIETDRQISEYQVNVLKNGGKVEGILKFKSSLNELQIKEIKNGYRENYATAKKSGDPLILGGDAEYQRLGLEPAELAYLETKNVTLNDICILTGVPKSVLASVDDVKFDNADASWKIFLRETIKPLLENLTAKLDLGLFDESIDLSFIDPTPEDEEALLDRLKAGNEINALTINEKREALGFDPIPDGDVILVPFSSTVLESVVNPPEPEPTDNADPAEKAAAGHPLRDPYIRKKYGELYLKKFDRREKAFLKLLRSYLNAQEKRLVDKLTVTRQYRRKGLADELWDQSLELKLAVEEFLPFLTEVLREAGEDAMRLVGSTPKFVLSDNIASWLEDKVEIFSRSINETTFDQLKSQFAESLDAGEDRKQLISRIQEQYGNISKKRATTIARTEIQGSSQKGAFEGYKQAGMGIKIWVAVQDANTRHAHSVADGQEKPIDMPFTVGGESLMYPGDPNGSAENVINCRCTV